MSKVLASAAISAALVIPAAAQAAAPPKPSSAVNVLVASGALNYNQKTFVAKAGLVKINFTNNSASPHNVSLEHDGEFEYGSTLTIKRSATTSFLMLAKGTYHLYSSIGNDEDRGMSATLIVK